MSIADDDLIMSDAQAETTTAAHDSDNYIDLQAAGIHVGDDLHLVARVNTTATSGGSATVKITFETDDNTSFSSATTIYETSAVPVASLTAGYEFVNLEIPRTPEMERYLHATITIATAALTAGKFDIFLAENLSKGAVV